MFDAKFFKHSYFSPQNLWSGWKEFTARGFPLLWRPPNDCEVCFWGTYYTSACHYPHLNMFWTIRSHIFTYFEIFVGEVRDAGIFIDILKWVKKNTLLLFLTTAQCQLTLLYFYKQSLYLHAFALLCQALLSKATGNWILDFGATSNSKLLLANGFFVWLIK